MGGKDRKERGERENGSSGRTEEHDHREQDHEERTRFRVSCGSGHGGHVVADLPALPLARLSHRGGGVINRRLGGGGEGKKPDEERGKEREIYIYIEREREGDSKGWRRRTSMGRELRVGRTSTWIR